MALNVRCIYFTFPHKCVTLLHLNGCSLHLFLHFHLQVCYIYSIALNVRYIYFAFPSVLHLNAASILHFRTSVLHLNGCPLHLFLQCAVAFTSSCISTGSSVRRAFVTKDAAPKHHISTLLLCSVQCAKLSVEYTIVHCTLYSEQ